MMKLDCDGCDSGSNECREDCVGAYGRIWRSLQSGGRFCVNVFSRNFASGTLNMFSYLK
jgi:hypothetical protein